MSPTRFGCLAGLFLTAGLMGCNREAGKSGPPPGNDRRADSIDSFRGSKAGDEREVGGIRLCWCPPGRFLMASPPDEPERRTDEAQVDVTMTEGFWMAKYEVT